MRGRSRNAGWKTGMAAWKGCSTKAIALVCTAVTAWGQQQSIAAQKPTGFIFVRPYKAASVPPIRTGNSMRLRDLIRGGRIYLTVQDAVALALENNIDLEIDRYNPLIGVWNIERAEGGGALPGVPSGTTQATQVASGQGVAGSQQAAGVTAGGNNSSNNNTVGASITQIGSTAPVFDQVVQSTQSYSHVSTPSANTLQTGTSNWIQSKHNYTDSISQGFYTGGTVTLTYNDSYLHENVPSDTPNPTTATTLEIQIQQPLLSGFGIALNTRAITVQRANLRIDNFTFQTEVMGTVANVLNLYYGLVADYEDVRAKQSAFEVAQRFYQDNKKQVQIGTMAPIDVTTAEAQVASTQQDLVVSQTTLAQGEVQLKNLLSRNGLADPLVTEADIVPLDRIVVPEQDNLAADEAIDCDCTGEPGRFTRRTVEPAKSADQRAEHYERRSSDFDWLGDREQSGTVRPAADNPSARRDSGYARRPDTSWTCALPSVPGRVGILLPGSK